MTNKSNFDILLSTDEKQGSCGQIFIAYDPYLFGSKEEIQAMLNERVAAADATHPDHEGGHVNCPGERTLRARAKSMAEGVNVNERIWSQIRPLAAGNRQTEDIANK